MGTGVLFAGGNLADRSNAGKDEQADFQIPLIDARILYEADADNLFVWTRHDDTLAWLAPETESFSQSPQPLGGPSANEWTAAPALQPRPVQHFPSRVFRGPLPVILASLLVTSRPTTPTSRSC
jgi:hypothetical protein